MSTDIWQPIVTIIIAILGALITSIIYITRLKARVDMIEQNQMNFKDEIKGLRNDFKEFCKDTSDKMNKVQESQVVLAKEFMLFSDRFSEDIKKLLNWYEKAIR